MNTIAELHVAYQEDDVAIGWRRALDDARHRLLAVAMGLESGATDPAALRRTARELDTVVHRLKWIADVSVDHETRASA